MITRLNIACSTCGAKYTPRIQIGHAKFQEHTFQCDDCGEDITINLDLNQDEGIIEAINLAVNCDGSDSEGKIINLNPEINFPLHLRHKDRIFPAIPSAEIRADIGNIDSIELERRRKLIKSWFDVVNEWPLVGKIWSLYNRNKESHARKLINRNNDKIYDNDTEITSILFLFACRCIAPAFDKQRECMFLRFGNIFRDNHSLFEDFLTYHHRNIYRQNMKRIQDVYHNFFSNYSEYSQVFYALKKGDDLTEHPSYTSTSFERTKRFYGDTYEALGSSVVTLACISNVLKGRRFDQFENMGLNQYLSIDKSGKGNCFSDIEEFSWIMNSYIPKLRNGSHHGSFQWDDVGKKILYQAGKKQRPEEIEYYKYLIHCVRLFFSCSALISLDIILAYSFENLKK